MDLTRPKRAATPSLRNGHLTGRRFLGTTDWAEVGSGQAQLAEQLVRQFEAAGGNADRPPADRVVGRRRDARARHLVPELAALDHHVTWLNSAQVGLDS